MDQPMTRYHENIIILTISLLWGLAFSMLILMSHAPRQVAIIHQIWPLIILLPFQLFLPVVFGRIARLLCRYFGRAVHSHSRRIIGIGCGVLAGASCEGLVFVMISGLDSLMTGNWARLFSRLIYSFQSGFVLALIPALVIALIGFLIILLLDKIRQPAQTAEKTISLVD
jgi:hypothetical protein